MTENCSQFEPINYGKLRAKQKELFNFQKVAATLADYGFNCIKLADDWQGADFLAYHINGTTTLKIQLKSRITIDKKYREKDIWIAFPHKHYWYLVKHDSLVEKIGKHTNWLKTRAWKDKGLYHSIAVNARLLGGLAEDKLGPVYGDVLLDDE